MVAYGINTDSHAAPQPPDPTHGPRVPRGCRALGRGQRRLLLHNSQHSSTAARGSFPADLSLGKVSPRTKAVTENSKENGLEVRQQGSDTGHARDFSCSAACRRHARQALARRAMCCPRAADSGRRHGSRLPVAACVPTSQEKAVSGHCGRHEVGVVGAAVRARRLNVAQAHSPRIVSTQRTHH